MHVEFILEEESAREALRNLVPRIVRPGISLSFIVHQGKKDLLDKLPNRLRGYGHWLPSDWRIVVLVDEDREDCHGLKTQMETMAKNAGLTTKSAPNVSGQFQVINRIAIEEIEAWFFGDVAAITAAFPRVPGTLASKAKYKNADAIRGGTWEALERVLLNAGYYRAGMPKVETASAISAHMDPALNSSRSFQVFREALQLL